MAGMDDHDALVPGLPRTRYYERYARGCGTCYGKCTVRAYTVLPAQGELYPEPSVRTARMRLVLVARTYSKQSLGRTCQHSLVLGRRQRAVLAVSVRLGQSSK